MAKNPEKRRKPIWPQHELVPIRTQVDVDEGKLETHKLNEVAQLIRLPASLSEEQENARIARALDLYESLAPADGLEGMLATQMVGTHHAILECLRRAALPDQTYDGRDMNLKHASNLMSLYTKQVAALDKHRGKGQQKVTVEHVNVAAGGQAIVGHVETSAPGKPMSPEGRAAPEEPTAPDPAAIEHKETIPVDLGAPKTKARRGKADKE